MLSPAAIGQQIGAAPEHDPRINLHRYPIHLHCDDGIITVDGEVEGAVEVAVADGACVALAYLHGRAIVLVSTPWPRMILWQEEEPQMHEVYEESLPLEHEMTEFLRELQRAVQGPTFSYHLEEVHTLVVRVRACWTRYQRRGAVEASMLIGL